MREIKFRGKIIRRRPIGQSGRKQKQNLKKLGGVIYLPQKYVGRKIHSIILTNTRGGKNETKEVKYK